MDIISVEDFRKVLFDERAEEIVRKYLFCRGSFVFHKRPEIDEILVNHLCSNLPLVPDDIAIVGSGKIGFSLSPYKFPRLFTDESDIDVIMVNAELFDHVWFSLLRWHYPRYWSGLHGEDGIFAQQRKKDIFFGFITLKSLRIDGISFPASLYPLRDLRSRWFNTFQSLSTYSEYPELTARKISGRLYRTWDHALGYHVAGLAELRNKLKKAS